MSTIPTKTRSPIGSAIVLVTTALSVCGACFSFSRDAEWSPETFEQMEFNSTPIQAGGKTANTVTISNESTSIFETPFRIKQVIILQKQMQILAAIGNLPEATKAAEAAVKFRPNDPDTHYNVACMNARQGKTDAAFAALKKSVELGFARSDAMNNDPDLTSLRSDKRFAQLMDQVKSSSAAAPKSTDPKTAPRDIVKSVAMVAEDNTRWNKKRRVLMPAFNIDVDSLSKLPVTKKHPVGEKLNNWYSDGTAAGLAGVYYDNHDRNHSNLKYQLFPQLTRVEYSREAKKLNLDTGLQLHMLFDGITLGNSSTAHVGGLFWRSNSRMFMTDSLAATQVYNQYMSNHIYFYPEHKDYDAGNHRPNYGDVFPTNTPFVITSFGSSHSDKPFMDAVMCTLASFHPDVRAVLQKRGILMPTVQMIFRRSQKHIKSDKDYLSGAAHPVVFDSKNLDPDAMMEMAHDMTLKDIPPIIQLRVVEEDRGVVGRDYFHVGPGENLLTTPVVIARAFRTVRAQRRMVIDAGSSADINGQPLTFHWKLLQGDPQLVTITPQGKNNSRAEIIIKHHKRAPISPGSKLESSRIDIGVFAKNKTHFSAPGFVTSFSINNEHRVYKDGKIQVVDYVHPESSLKYTDPTIDFRKTWRDRYRYDSSGNLTGWSRFRGSRKEEFTKDGILVEETDSLGRPKTGRLVRYLPAAKNKYPTLQQAATDIKIGFKYASDKATIGKPYRIQK